MSMKQIGGLDWHSESVDAQHACRKYKFKVQAFLRERGLEFNEWRSAGGKKQRLYFKHPSSDRFGKNGVIEGWLDFANGDYQLSCDMPKLEAFLNAEGFVKRETRFLTQHI
jgi:hypothetical protein